MVWFVVTVIVAHVDVLFFQPGSMKGYPFPIELS